jgi:hypothetical protein
VPLPPQNRTLSCIDDVWVAMCLCIEHPILRRVQGWVHGSSYLLCPFLRCMRLLSALAERGHRGRTSQFEEVQLQQRRVMSSQWAVAGKRAHSPGGLQAIMHAETLLYSYCSSISDQLGRLPHMETARPPRPRTLLHSYQGFVCVAHPAAAMEAHNGLDVKMTACGDRHRFQPSGWSSAE